MNSTLTSREDNIHIEYAKKYEGYFGGIAGLRYDYRFWNERYNAGAEVTARYYTNDFPFSLHYGIHIGYNF